MARPQEGGWGPRPATGLGPYLGRRYGAQAPGWGRGHQAPGSGPEAKGEHRDPQIIMKRGLIAASTFMAAAAADFVAVVAMTTVTVAGVITSGVRLADVHVASVVVAGVVVAVSLWLVSRCLVSLWPVSLWLASLWLLSSWRMLLLLVSS